MEDAIEYTIQFSYYLEAHEIYIPKKRKKPREKQPEKSLTKERNIYVGE